VWHPKNVNIGVCWRNDSVIKGVGIMRNDRTKRIVKGLIAVFIGGLYLLNPTAGLIEILPDVLPIVGNLDEAAATALLLYGIRELRSKPNIIIEG
jgi:hypothetical protein